MESNMSCDEEPPKKLEDMVEPEEEDEDEEEEKKKEPKIEININFLHTSDGKMMK